MKGINVKKHQKSKGGKYRSSRGLSIALFQYANAPFGFAKPNINYRKKKKINRWKEIIPWRNPGISKIA